jgi:hypothetical protein
MNWELWLSLTSPSGPSTPFANDAITAVDCIRIVFIAVAFLILLLTPAVIDKCVTLGQKVRIFAVLGFAIICAIGEGGHFGDYFNWIFVAKWLLILATLWGFWSFVRYESPTEYSLTPLSFKNRERPDVPGN